METKEIESRVLPQLNGTTKDLVNNGIWFLYTLSDSPVKEAVYCLVADKTYLLNSQGNIVSVPVVDIQKINCKERLLFSDLPKPIVQENVAVKWA